MRLRHVVLFAVCLALAPRSAVSGGPITSGITTSGSVAGPSFLESWTFSGTVGNRVVITAITTSGTLNTNIVLKAPGGAVEISTSAGDRLDWGLLATGTYTIEIQDLGLDDTGNYALGFLNVTAGPLTSGGDTDGGAIVSADITSGTTSGAADIDAFTFSGTLGNRVIIDAVATAGPGYDTTILLYPPGGGSYATYVTSDRLEYRLTASGTWTILIEDNGDDIGGSYSLSFLNVTAGPLSNGADADGGPITSNQILGGTIQNGVDLDAFTFFGLAGTRVAIVGLSTSGQLNTSMTLYPPNGAAPETGTNSGDVIDWQLATSGTYTVVIEDYGNDQTGTYTLSMLNLTAGPLTTAGDPDGGALTSSDVKSGTIGGIGDMDAFTFQGNFGDRIIIDAVATGGPGFNTFISLYPPNGGPVATYTGGDRLEYQVNSPGTWTVLIVDNGYDTAGSYSLSLLNVTSGPLTRIIDQDGGPIASNEIKTGQFQQGVDLDAFTFNGSAGQRVLVLALATGGGSHNTTLSLYPPGGGAAEVSSNSGDVIDWQLVGNGLYTVVVEDYGNDNAGTYTISYLNVTGGPLTNGSDPDGGPITSAAVKTGSISGTADLDAFTFAGSVGDRVLIDAVATGGASFNTYIALYPPGGGSVANYSSSDRMEFQLYSTGTWTIVIQDSGNDTAGTYEMSLLNVTSGPHTSGSDTDGNVLISNTISTGQFNQGVDFDAFTFTGSVGDRVLLTGVATGGGSHNTTMTLYPPGGLGAEASTNSGDALDVALLRTGTYTVVIEDYGNDNAGAYSISMLNVTAGPLTDGTDPDGGPISSADVRTGTISGTGDLDAFTFTGNAGARVLIDAIATAGPGFNTYIVLYPPNGGPATVYTGSDRLEYQLNASGTWTIVIEDSGYDAPGSYELSLLNITGGPLKNGADPDGGPIVSAEILTGQFQQGVDFDAFTFTGTAGQRVVIAGVATGGGSHNTNLTLYPPSGYGAEATTSSGDRLDSQLQRTGTYTVVIEDFGNDNAGTYTISFLNLSGGPLTSAGDTNGGPMVSNQVLSGTTSGVGDFDAYTFTAHFGERVLAIAIATSGASFNTNIVAYPPNGAAAVNYTSTDRLEFVCNATGTWTVLIEDVGNDAAGGYTMSILNISSGPYTNGPEADGGPILDNVPRNGSVFSVADADGYTFYGIVGMTANITATATSGTLNTNLALYPPNGGTALLFTSADNIAPVLPTNGLYTLVIEDWGDDETGSYTVNVDLSGGVTGVGDTPPAELALHAGVPSPFSQTTRFDYELPAAERVRIDVYDVRGAHVRTLVDEKRGAGRYGAIWDGRDDAGRGVASGVYYVRMKSGADVKRQKIVRVR